jgi:hypothetical protein
MKVLSWLIPLAGLSAAVLSMFVFRRADILLVFLTLSVTFMASMYFYLNIRMWDRNAQVWQVVRRQLEIIKVRWSTLTSAEQKNIEQLITQTEDALKLSWQSRVPDVVEVAKYGV